MREELKNYCDLFIKNKKAAKAAFPFSATPIAGSIVLTGKGEEASVEKLKAAGEVLKAHEGALSVFRNNMKVPAICMIAMADNPDAFIKRLRSTYDKLNAGKVFDSEYNTITSMVLNQKADDSQIDEYVKKTQEIFKMMKEQHPMLTGSNDMPFAGIIAATEKDPAEVLKKAEKCYAILRNRFPASNAVQPLSQILGITDGDAEELANKTIDLYNAFEKEGLRFSKGPELATLGSLAGLDLSVDEIVEEAKEVYKYLDKNGAYGFLETGKAERVMFAATLAMMAHNSPNKEQMLETALSAQLALALTIQLCVIIATVSAVSAASSSH